MTFRLAAQESKLGDGSLPSKFELVQSLGFDGIELNARGSGPFAARRDELIAAKRAGVVMPTAVIGLKDYIGSFDPEQRRRAIDGRKQILTTLGEIGCDGLVMPNGFAVFSKYLPPFVPPRPEGQSRAALVDALGELGAHAMSVGTSIFLEPLNRYEDYLINTLGDALAVVEEVDSPAVNVIADTFHMSIEEISIADAISLAGPRLRHVQLGDSGRLEPGTGHYNWPETLAALHAIGYRGWLAMECGLSDTVENVLPRVATILRR